VQFCFKVTISSWPFVYLIFKALYNEILSVLLPNDDIVDLETEIAPDGMDGEQTWPTDEELAQAEHKGEGIESNNGFQTFICLSLFILYLYSSFIFFIFIYPSLHSSFSKAKK